MKEDNRRETMIALAQELADLSHKYGVHLSKSYAPGDCSGIDLCFDSGESFEVELGGGECIIGDGAYRVVFAKAEALKTPEDNWVTKNKMLGGTWADGAL